MSIAATHNTAEDGRTFTDLRRGIRRIARASMREPEIDNLQVFIPLLQPDGRGWS
jgi:hypothetical protein